MARNRGCGISDNDRTAGGVQCGKGPVATGSGAGTIIGYDSEMISGAGSQASDVRTNTLGRVSGFSMGGSRESVAGGCSILKINTGGQSVGVNRAVEFG